MNISSIYSSFLTKDFDSLKQLIKDNSRYKSEMDDTLVSSTILSTSTKPSMNSNHNSVANTGNFSVTCPFGSLYEDNSICYYKNISVDGYRIRRGRRGDTKGEHSIE